MGRRPRGPRRGHERQRLEAWRPDEARRHALLALRPLCARGGHPRERVPQPQRLLVEQQRPPQQRQPGRAEAQRRAVAAAIERDRAAARQAVREQQRRPADHVVHRAVPRHDLPRVGARLPVDDQPVDDVLRRQVARIEAVHDLRRGQRRPAVRLHAGPDQQPPELVARCPHAPRVDAALERPQQLREARARRRGRRNREQRRLPLRVARRDRRAVVEPVPRVRVAEARPADRLQRVLDRPVPAEVEPAHIDQRRHEAPVARGPHRGDRLEGVRVRRQAARRQRRVRSPADRAVEQRHDRGLCQRPARHRVRRRRRRARRRRVRPPRRRARGLGRVLAGHAGDEQRERREERRGRDAAPHARGRP